MDWLQFLASVIQSLASLAWPLALFGVVFLFRAQIRELLPSLRLKHGDTEVSFLLEKAEDRAIVVAAAQPPDQHTLVPQADDELARLARLSPRAAILDVGVQLEESIHKLAEAVGLDRSRNKLTFYLAKELLERGIIDNDLNSLLFNLRRIQIRANYRAEANFSEEEAISFAQLARVAMASLDGARANL